MDNHSKMTMYDTSTMTSPVTKTAKTPKWLMPYPCSQFCADVKFDIRFDTKLGDSDFGTKLRSYGIV